MDFYFYFRSATSNGKSFIFRGFRVLLSTCSFLIFLHSFAYAQQSLPDLSQQQLQQYQQRQRELGRIAPPNNTIIEGTQQPAAPETGVCIAINKIEVDGADHLSPAKIQSAMRPYIGRCLGLSGIQEVINAINELYVKNGDITSRAYLPQQDLSGGSLKIIVVEGKLEAFKFDGQKPSWHQMAAFPGLEGKILNLRDLEQGLEQMNRLPGWNATMQVTPGSKQGQSVVVITAPSAPILTGRAWVDNNGSQQTGRWDGNISANLADPLGLLGLYSFEYNRNVFPATTDRESNYLTASFSIPHGYWTFFGDFNYSNYRYNVFDVVGNIKLSGWTQQVDVGIDRVLQRGQTDKTTLEFRYTHKQINSSLDNITLETGSEALSSVASRLSYSRNIWGGAWYTTLGLQWGLPPGEGTAETLPVTADYVPHAAYVKPTIDINGYQPITINGQHLIWEPSLHAEYANVREYATDELQLGGLYTVRGFLQNTLSGDRGFYFHNDLIWSLPKLDLPGPWPMENAVYAGLDTGWTEVDAASPGTPAALFGGFLTGTAFGLRSSLGPFYSDVSAAHALETGPLPPEGWIISAQIGVNF